MLVISKLSNFQTENLNAQKRLKTAITKLRSFLSPELTKKQPVQSDQQPIQPEDLKTNLPSESESERIPIDDPAEFYDESSKITDEDFQDIEGDDFEKDEGQTTNFLSDTDRDLPAFPDEFTASENRKSPENVESHANVKSADDFDPPMFLASEEDDDDENGIKPDENLSELTAEDIAGKLHDIEEELVEKVLIRNHGYYENNPDEIPDYDNP